MIHNVENPEPVARIQAIAHEIGRPNLIRMPGNQKRLTHPLRQPFLCPSFLIEMQLTIYSIHAFMVPRVTTPAKGSKALPESPAGMMRNHFVQSPDNIGIAFRVILWNLVICCPG